MTMPPCSACKTGAIFVHASEVTLTVMVTSDWQVDAYASWDCPQCQAAQKVHIAPHAYRHLALTGATALAKQWTVSCSPGVLSEAPDTVPAEWVTAPPPADPPPAAFGKPCWDCGEVLDLPLTDVSIMVLEVADGVAPPFAAWDCPAPRCRAANLLALTMRAAGRLDRAGARSALGRPTARHEEFEVPDTLPAEWGTAPPPHGDGR